MTNPLTIFGIMVDHRAEVSPDMQEVISRYGDEILCRMGIPSPSKEKGLITLVFEGEPGQVEGFRKELTGISGLTVQTMHFFQ